MSEITRVAIGGVVLFWWLVLVGVYGGTFLASWGVADTILDTRVLEGIVWE